MSFNVNNTGYNAYRTQYDYGKKTDTTRKAAETDKPDFGESTLSVKAQDFLKNIREKYGDFDIFVGDSEEALDAQSAGSDKDISVMFSADEIEKMAEDEDYANERLSQMETAVADARKFVEDYNNSDESKESGTVITGIKITMNPDGTTSLFAELEKVTEEQRKRIEESREKKAEEAKKENAEKADDNKDKEVKPEKEEPYKPGPRTRIEADTFDELLEKIKAFDWSTVDKSDEQFKGQHIDFSV
ncbi:MAG: DUF6033 family protein [Lachnospiraceae bacterium]|nr:DUF6033 family protein [Lachnospiraceae bacterium]